ncbi:MAG: secondary thiamine-phosphate synthase enzyme YjbQ [Myxococcota bacterium]|nr:secondary thiamine-phosphate synthase enzyme YjbQ [Myxococcota bacterium]
MIHQEERTIETRGHGTYELTRELQRVVARSGIAKGLATIFVHHTSASLIINENADPEVRRDLDAFLDRLVPDGDRLFEHVAEA